MAKKQTNYIARFKAQKHAERIGFKPLGDTNCFYGENPDGSKIRLNMRDMNILKMEKKVKCTEEEQVTNGGRYAKWVILDQCKYTSAVLEEKGIGFKK